MPQMVKDLGMNINKEDHFKKLNQYAVAAMKDVETPVNIRETSSENLKDLFIKVFEQIEK